MSVKVGINGFGRMGRLTMRALYNSDNIEIVQINDPAGDAATLAHLMNFDSVHGRWEHEALAEQNDMMIGKHRIHVTHNTLLEDTDWSGCDLVLEASGKIKTKEKLTGYLTQGVKHVVVTAPVKEEGVLNIVMGVNHDQYDKSQFPIVTAASCTTNCLAPVVKVLQDKIGIVHGSMTTIHDITNTQTILDAPHKDLRRARACGASLIPTTTGSATAITHIFPELKGKLNGHAIRVPLANASITDCVFEVSRATTKEEINAWMEDAANGAMQGILGYETRPLVSVDYKTDARSSIVDALSTMVINDTQVKMYLWYDNEWGYANRTADLVRYVIAENG
ncbi:ArsJ-associated glyceraldehyde-3-phosphate dehydrogenase [Pseudoalteromonas sp. MMG013]|uniref:ArsJ-associated glyceraldehyde-3-phosphate dehydrogenase n=1 Tax=Pseudoalteromonas sp. MMG013 TaxID=2822687 RepID=UPI001B36874D|nr:ArsJ-associated glyceraldehyde-3-phosphate dehydrogenase [Pseudoalteromonas sp. MMG013]MBQ4862753.1 ArsJ-associated glyceraldehyde-3-phosphate dehydrogenase [Pseudoalteromonas sp. MMG013]